MLPDSIESQLTARFNPSQLNKEGSLADCDASSVACGVSVCVNRSEILVAVRASLVLTMVYWKISVAAAPGISLDEGMMVVSSTPGTG